MAVIPNVATIALHAGNYIPSSMDCQKVLNWVSSEAHQVCETIGILTAVKIPSYCRYYDLIL